MDNAINRLTFVIVRWDTLVKTVLRIYVLINAMVMANVLIQVVNVRVNMKE